MAKTPETVDSKALAALATRLSDGQWHSMPDCTEALALLRAVGLQGESSADNKLRLLRPIQLLDSALIQQGLTQATRDQLNSFAVESVIDSTNAAVLGNGTEPAEQARICLAEFQSAGRGRANRRWIAPYASGLCLSLGWGFEPTPEHLSSLSLAIGVATIAALDQCRIAGVALKWPNDLVVEDRKLGGILIEAAVPGPGRRDVVIGIGLNGYLTKQQCDQISASNGVIPVALSHLNGGAEHDRNRLAATIINEVVAMLQRFTQQGTAAWLTRFEQLDALRGRQIEVLEHNSTFTGIAEGIDNTGALLVHADGLQRRLLSGEVSVRAQ